MIGGSALGRSLADALLGCDTQEDDEEKWRKEYDKKKNIKTGNPAKKRFKLSAATIPPEACELDLERIYMDLRRFS